MGRILITGANGFIGSTLVEKALQLGFEVTAGVRATSDLSLIKNKPIQFLDLDFRDESILKSKFLQTGRFDYIIHNAGITKAPNQQVYFDINAGNTERFVNVLRNNALTPDKFIFISSIAALGPTNEGSIITANNQANPVTSYGASKLKAEQFFKSLNDFPWIAIQPTAVYGPKDKDILIFINLVNKGFELYIGTGKQTLSFIYSKDLVDVIFSALEKGIIGKKYLVSDNRSYQKDDLGKAVKEALNKKALKIKLPLGIIRPIAYITEKIATFKGTSPALNIEKLNELAAESWHCDPTETFSDLNFIPSHDLFSGMKETVEWYKEHKWL